MILSKRQELREKLKFGDVTRIARLAKVDYQTANNWFKGRTDNRAVEVCAKALAKKRENELKETLAKISTND